MKNSIITLLSVFIFSSVFSQTVLKSSENYVSGFDQKLNGNEIEYTSGVEGVSKALIVRASNGKQSMSWKSAIVSPDSNHETVTFINYIGYDSRKQGTAFHFFMNDEKLGDLVLPQGGTKNWEITFENGSKMVFKHHFTDGNHDKFGFLFLEVPSKLLLKDAQVKFEFIGEEKDELTWLMLFKKSFSEGLDVVCFPSIISKGSEKFQSLLAEINYLRAPVKTQIFIDGALDRTIDLVTGIQSVELLYPEVSKEKTVLIELKSETLNLSKSVVVKPVRKWQINFVQHSHTDIGYTRSQTEILAEHLRYIDYALDYCDATDHYPEASKFRWTCEASWAVDEYLNTRPQAQIDRLKKRVEEGRIEVTGMYFNFSELPDEQTLAASLAPIKSINEKGIPVTSAMQNDVNGIGWAMNDYFNTLDVKYLNMGTHGHKALIAFDYPTAFWWVSPSGKKMLAFRAEHYMIGNTAFGVHLEDFAFFERNVLRYLNKMEKKGYAYDLISIQHSGFLTDNSPPSILASTMIQKWNEKYEWPKIRTSIVSEFFEEIEEKHGNELEEIKGHWPDWWTDGFASGAREVAASRNAHVNLIAGQGGLSMAKLLGAKMPSGLNERIFETNKALLFYGEHTFGAAESISDPYGASTMEQREIKESYAWEASRRANMIDEEALGLLNEFVGKEEEPSLVVYNTLTWNRSGLLSLFIDHEQIPVGKTMYLLDDNGKKFPAQIKKPWHGGSYWSMWVDDIPSFGFKKFRMIVEDVKTHTHDGTGSHTHDDEPIYKEENELITIDNDWYTIVISKSKGAIIQIYDKELRKNLVDEDATYNVGAFILEKLAEREQLQSTVEDNGSKYGHLTDYSRHPLDSVWLSQIKSGPIWNTIRFKGKTSTAYDEGDGFVFDIKLYNTAKRIDLAYQLKKKPILSPESFYIAFPFLLDQGNIHLEVAGGLMKAGFDQIPGSANDWNTVQNYVSVKNEEHQIVLVSHEAPLVQLGNINTGRFKYRATPESTHIFSWPMNNYWVTNFNPDQRGMFTWNYNLTSLNSNSAVAATKFSWAARIPFLGRVIPSGKPEGKKENSFSLLSAIPENVLLINASPVPNENAVIFQFREVGNIPVNFIPNCKLKPQGKWQKVNVLGEVVENVKEVEIDGLESVFYKFYW